MTEKTDTVPATEQPHPALILEPAYVDEKTGALYVHKDLAQAQAPYAHEAHISPIAVEERFGDVASWAAYTIRYADEADVKPLLTWNLKGLRTVLDYHDSDGTPGRCKWLATLAFQQSREWAFWTKLADGSAVPHRKAVESLEDHAEDITSPVATELMALLRSLRAHVTATAATELRPDGTSAVEFRTDKTVLARGLELPGTLEIQVPVLRGQADAEGRPVRYRVQVRLRASLDDSAHLALRFSMPTAERVWEEVTGEAVARAETLLGADYPLLRAEG